MTDDFHVTQLTGTPCAPFNCAAASGAMGIAAGSGYEDKMSADAFRAQAAVSCVPGAHSNSGGLFISDVERVFAFHGIPVDYGRVNDDAPPMRWPAPTLATRLSKGDGAILLGDYDALPVQYRASATFKGDHSTWVHDYRSDGTIHWHDPLRKAGIRIPISAALSYWQKPLSAVRGFAGFVKVKENDVAGLGIDHLESRPGTVRVKNIAGVEARQVADNERFVLAPGTEKPTIGKGRLIGDPLGKDADFGGQDRHTVWLIGGELAVVLDSQVTFEPYKA
ncbi:MAG TPA: hypothetical protein VFV72_01010 [Candidatus Limnocylindrales bacterium]|nr:hypothetical protein [Candidatus Limnocylindrales bacterium]